jgi:glycosyltransferase involved in cell wall biosynthesis
MAGILGQTLQDFNCIVLDNCSTDGTAEWIEGLGDSRVVVIRSERSLTIEENWRRILGVPKNEFMTMIGHDDVLLPHYLQEMDDLIARYPDAGLYQTHYSYIDQDGKFLRACLPMDEKQYAHEFLACQMMRTIESTGTGYMMRSVDFDKAGGMPTEYPNLIFSDYALWMKLMMGRFKATSVRDCFSYRLHLSLSRTTNGIAYQDAFGKYIALVYALMQEDVRVRLVVTRYGKDFLLYYCEALSHRMLKSPARLRMRTVKEYVAICEGYAARLIPGQEFRPMERRGTRAAVWIDSNGLSRWLFRLVKRAL